MTPGPISKKVVSDRLDWIEKMLAEIRSLPLHDYKNFIGDKRNVWSAESYLRRSLEALFDLGRHLLARGFKMGVSELGWNRKSFIKFAKKSFGTSRG